MLWLLLIAVIVLAGAFYMWMNARAERDWDNPDAGSAMDEFGRAFPDEAIRALTHATEVDHSTAELHLTLGNLFRKRGEVDRALRVHEALLARPNLRDDLRHQTMFELAQDYLKAGLIDRAEHLFQELAGRGLDSPQHAFHVDLQDFLHLVRHHVRQSLDLRDAGVVDHDVEAAEFLLGVIDGFVNPVTLRDIRPECRGLPANCPHFIRDGARLVVLEIHERYVGSVPGQPERNGATDAS